MSALTHKFGLELDLTSLEAQRADHKKRIEAAIRRNNGISFAEFSLQHPDIVVVEYDPCITTPNDIYKKVKRLNGAIKKKVFL